MGWPLRRKIIVGFASALMLLVAVDVVSYRSLRRLLETGDAVAHSQRVLEQLDQVLLHLQDAETGQRGYIITGEASYLAPYDTAVRTIDHELTALDRLLTNVDQPQHFKQLRQLIAAKLRELDQTIDERRQGQLNRAAAIVRSGEGKRLMDDIRRVVDTLRSAEHDRLAQRHDGSTASARATFWILGLGSLLGFVLIGIAVIRINRDVLERQHAEEALQRAHAELEARVDERTAQLALANAELARSRDELLSVFNQLRFGVVVTDAEGRVTFISQAAERLFNKRKQDVARRSWRELFRFGEEDARRLQLMSDAPPHLRAKVPVDIETAGGRRCCMEIEVHDDPRDTSRKIFLLYDMSEVYDLRRLLDEKAQFHGLVGQSPSMQMIYRQIRDLSTVDSTVLIEGETGTGKELVARAIHLCGSRRHRPFVPVNCGGLTDSLLGSQLFGHRRGAFTGAFEDHKGFFEAADGGTIFLDEIGDLPPTVQTALLRVLQEREVQRLGDSRARQVDVRVLVATQHNLAQAVELGQFRADLLYRIRVARIHLPPLRKRLDDLPLLVASFLADCRAATGKGIESISHQAMQVLLRYSWPGNVRELKSAIESAVIRCQRSIVEADDLPPEISSSTFGPVPNSVAVEEQAERLRVALARTGGNRAAAARLLGVSRATLYRRFATALRDRPDSSSTS